MSSPIRGRALVINNENFQGTCGKREGSGVDVTNLEGLLTSLSFELTVATDLTAEVDIIRRI